MKVSWLQLFILSFSLLHTPASALKKSYVVYLGGHSHGLDASEIELSRATDSHYELLGSHLGSLEKAKDAIFYSYNKHINGFAAMLEEEEAQTLSKDPKVVSIFLNKVKQLHTTRSWSFLGIEKNGKITPNSIWHKARFGEDTIIANFDTGVWPESESFKDDKMGPIPSKWRGICQNNTEIGVTCNRKLIGARYYNQGFLAAAKDQNITIDATHNVNSARDTEGHGTHTLSTAGGGFVPAASVFGYGKGTVKGGSPKARVAAYKVCWDKGCFDADILAAMDQAIHDRVDVMSLSLGGDPANYFEDVTSIGAFHAVQKGIVVICSAGNSGPSAGTATNLAPWIITVGASTIDRDFQSYAVLGNNHSYKGETLSDKSLPPKKYYPMIAGADAKAANAIAANATLCLPGTLDPEKVKGKILICVRGVSARADKGVQARKAGAVGMILCNDEAHGNEMIADGHVLPAAQLSYSDGQAVLHYVNSTKSPVGYLTPGRTQLNTKPAPYMASFTSRGPNTITPEILKPDITAPGVSIIAAYTEATSPTGLDDDSRRVPFNVESGTSMACPHISGVAGLLKTLHPDWSPAAVKSAIMTSASLIDNVPEPILDSSFTKATPFAFGAGQVWPNHAANPGLVYDLGTHDYLDFLCGIGYNATQIGVFTNKPHRCHESYSILDFNYPSITVPSFSGSVTVTRRVKNVGSHSSTYKIKVVEPDEISVCVEPTKLEFKKLGEEKSFKVTLKAKSETAAKDYVFGKLILSDGLHYVRSPIVVKAK